MHKAALLLSLTVLAAVTVALAQPASAASYTLAIDPGDCVQVQTGDGSTPAGAEWSMRAAATFQGVVRSSGSYAYGPAIDDTHAGSVPGPGNYFFTACHVCPTGGPITVDFQLPDPPIGGGPQYFAAQDPGDLSGCNTGSGPEGLDEVGMFLGPLGIVVAIGALLVILGLPVPAQAQQAPPPGPAPPAPPRPQLQPTPWVLPLQEGPAPPPMAGPGPRLVPTPWIGVWHRVPADAPMQAPPGARPVGYPFPPDTWASMTCPWCQQVTLSPFKDGWFCTNLQCALRGPGSGQRTELVSKDWYR